MGKKELIMKKAYEKFITNGYEETSVDEILKEIGVAKGTFYYYFKSKEELLEILIDNLIDEKCKGTEIVSKSNLGVLEKLVQIILSMRLQNEEKEINSIIHKPRNVLMHQKIIKKLTEKMTSLLTPVILEGIEQKIFNTKYPEETVKMILILGQTLFDDNFLDIKEEEKERYVLCFIYMVEKLLGAKENSMLNILALF